MTNRPLRLLLVEDNDDDAALVLRELTRAGFAPSVSRAENGPAFSQRLAESAWDLVISDYALPGFSGLEALRLLRQHDADVPFILVSGTVGEDLAVAAIRQGAQDYLIKDRLARLGPAVERELREAALVRERRRAEEAMRENEHRHRMLVETVGAIPWEIDTTGRLLYIGPQAERILGHGMGRWYEPGFWQRTVHPDDLERVSVGLRTALEAGQPAESTYRLRHSDGTWRWFLDIAVAATGNQGQGVVRGFLVDVTITHQAEERRQQAEAEQRRLEQQLLHSQKLEAIGTLAGGIAHDFNNILTALIGNAHLLEAHVPSSSPGHQHLVGIRAATQRAQELVRQILTFSRRQEPQSRSLQAEDIVGEAVSLLRATIPSSIAVDFTCADEVPPVLADSGQLHQVVMNLCTNAYHAMQGLPSGGVLGVRVSSRSEGASRWVVIEISDTGIGMTPEVRKRIFEPFFTTKPVGQGTGLGLAVVHGIITAHGGRLEIDSEPGSGSCFRVFLPALATASITSAVKDADLPLGSGQEILVVDDELMIRQLGVDLLELLGYRGLPSATPQEALSLVTAEPARFAAIITDLTMPGMLGTTLALRLADLAPGVPIILSSGDLHAVDALKSKHPALQGILAKPYALKDMAELLARLVPAAGT